MIRNIIFGLRSILYQLTYSISPKTPKSIILCYHTVGGPGWDYNVKLDDFKRQIDYLLTRYKPTTLGKIFTSSQPSFAITFDDGYKNIFKIHQYLESKKIYPTIFILSDKKHLNHQELDNNISLLKNWQIRKLISLGWEIGSHGSQHHDFWKIADADISSEIVESKKILESKFKVPVNYFSYPKGRYTPFIVNAVSQAGYKLAVTTDDGILNQTSNPYLIPRLVIDRTHSFSEFKRVLTISSITARKIIKKLGGRLLAKLV